jgi:hypothetical protein
MIVTRAAQLQPNQKRGILMKTRRTVVNTIASLTFSTMLMAAQMQNAGEHTWDEQVS